ncbi:MAG: hypothetical protein HeimC3_32120 [Candidatus Heimdallarchaeota archaeon LC_3]|nr:MAG: hypothetical protein HeimC3_32120 [Candidatus Heimdallarchaeota archaeon LC_3]
MEMDFFEDNFTKLFFNTETGEVNHESLSDYVQTAINVAEDVIWELALEKTSLKELNQARDELRKYILRFFDFMRWMREYDGKTHSLRDKINIIDSAVVVIKKEMDLIDSEVATLKQNAIAEKTLKATRRAITIAYIALVISISFNLLFIIDRIFFGSN